LRGFSWDLAEEEQSAGVVDFIVFDPGFDDADFYDAEQVLRRIERKE